MPALVVRGLTTGRAGGFLDEVGVAPSLAVWALDTALTAWSARIFARGTRLRA